MHQHTHGGGIDQTAVIGHPPESRTWKPGIPYFAPIIDKTARIEAFVTVDAGTTSTPTYVGPRAWIMSHAHIGHDACIDQDAEVCTAAIIGGHAWVQAGARVGINATVLPHRIIGKGAVIGAGSVVTRDVPAGVTVAGNPARIVQSHLLPHTLRPAGDRIVR